MSQSQFLILPSRSEMEEALKTLEKRGLSSRFLKSTGNHNSLFLKLDSELPGGSYKIRGVEFFAKKRGNIQDPVQVLSAGNLAIATAMRFNEEHIHTIAIVPDGISQIKREQLEQIGASIEEKPFSRIWEIVLNEDRQSKTFLHPFNKFLLAGYATLILEMKKAGFTEGFLVIPYGLGGLATALAHAIEIFHMNIKLYLCEVSGFAPFLRARQANAPVEGKKLSSFIEAMGTPVVIPDIFDFLNSRVSGVIEVTEEEVKQEIRNASKDYGIRLEGAAGASLAAAKKLITQNLTKKENVFTLLTGSNISENVFQSIVNIPKSL